MLHVLFHIGDERYALDSERVKEIVPLVRLSGVPRAPEYVSGLFRYRSQVVPVIDLRCLAGLGASRRFLSTRVILVDYRDRYGRQQVLGLLAERVTDTMQVDPSELASSGIQVKDTPYLGRVIADPQGLIHCIEVEDLLPPTVQDLLFPSEESSS